MAAWVGTYGTDAFGENAYPRPATVVMQYTGLSEVTGEEPPTYACVGTRDGLTHGFGLGEGTVAEGWLDHAVEFWESNMR